MNVLQVTDRYSEGGLEKFIDLFSSELACQGHRSYLAVGTLDASEASLLSQTAIFEDFGFKYGVSESVQSYLEDIDRLCQIILECRIDLVLIHPFYSLYPAVAAAQLSKVPVAFVLHGLISASYPLTFSEHALYRLAVDSSINCLFSVQRMLGATVTKNVPVYHLKNPIDHLEMRPCESDLLKSKKWAICSRIDSYKVESIKRFLLWLPELEIEHVDVYGDGDCLEQLQSFVEAAGLSHMISWHSFDLLWREKVREKNCGVIGLGRVAIEALAINLPVIMLSVDGNPYGLIDHALFDQSKDANFSRADISTLSDPKQLQSQLDCLMSDPSPFLLGADALSQFSAKVTVDAFLDAVTTERGVIGLRLVPAWADMVEALRMEDDKAFPYLDVLERDNILWDCFHAAVPQEPARSALLLSSLASHQIEERLARISLGQQFDSHKADFDDVRARASDRHDTLLKSSELIEKALVSIDGLYAANNKIICTLESQEHIAKELKREVDELGKDLSGIKKSYSWKIGRAITAFPRWVIRRTKRL